MKEQYGKKLADKLSKEFTDVERMVLMMNILLTIVEKDEQAALEYLDVARINFDAIKE